MTSEITTVLIILGLAIILFVTERIRPDLTALLVLVSLAISGIITPEEALSGFSSPAVVTVWAILILSGALSQTGISNLVGKRILHWSGSGEGKLLFVIMLTAGIFSGLMNSIGVVSLFLPVVIDIAHTTRRAPSKLLMPLSFAALLGGLITLVGTPPNILISQALSDAGLEPFKMFDFTPVGAPVMLAGIVFIALIGRKLLPVRDITQEFSEGASHSRDLFELQDRMGIIQIPKDSTLVGKSLIESRLGVILGLNVIAILRGEHHTQLAPDPHEIIQAEDRLLVEGRMERLNEFFGQMHLAVEEQDLHLESLSSTALELVECQIHPNSPLEGKTLGQLNFRRRLGAIVLAIRRGTDTWRTNLERITLQSGDLLLMHGTSAQLENVRAFDPGLTIQPINAEIYHLEERLMMLRVQPDSSLAGKTLTESRLGEAFDLGVMGILRRGKMELLPEPDATIQVGDLLLVKGKRSDLLTVQGFQNLQISTEGLPKLDELESEQVGLYQVVLSPYSTLAGKTLRELHFRAKFGLNVLAIWREGRAHRSDLGNMAIHFGDAFLLYGARQKLRVLSSDPDFLVLSETVKEKLRTHKAPLALMILAIVLLPVILGWVSIAIAAIAGVTLMVLTGCISMDEAYRSIQLNAVFLIAGMLPLGVALQKTGAAQYLADGMVRLVGPWGPMAIMGGLFILAVLASQVMPNPAVALLLAPIALSTANSMGISPYPLMMTIAISCSAAFLSPVGHSANILVMGLGGYKFSDYTRLGLPLTLIVMVIALVLIPVFWPL